MSPNLKEEQNLSQKRGHSLRFMINKNCEAGSFGEAFLDFIITRASFKKFLAKHIHKKRVNNFYDLFSKIHFATYNQNPYSLEQKFYFDEDFERKRKILLKKLDNMCNLETKDEKKQKSDQKEDTNSNKKKEDFNEFILADRARKSKLSTE